MTIWIYNFPLWERGRMASEQWRGELVQLNGVEAFILYNYRAPTECQSLLDV